MRILHTGDLHIGREYKKQERENPEIAARYRQARIQALINIVHIANEKKCDYIVIAGDLYDKHDVPLTLHKQVCSILDEFNGITVVIPGNHDYCEGPQDKVWSAFRNFTGQNTILLDSNEIYITNDVVFYPCICNDRYSQDNALGWLKSNPVRDVDRINIGIAHGAISGLSYDREKKYYYMSEEELEECNIDLWLIGHTHIPYPDKDMIENQKIFNAGTPQQTDIADNSEGTAFVIDIDGSGHISAVKVATGDIYFRKKNLEMNHGDYLRDRIVDVVSDTECARTTIRLEITGTCLKEDYDHRFEIYREFEDKFLKFEVTDDELNEEITSQMIDAQTVEGSVENKLLKQYLNEPEILNLAYDLVRQCKE